MHTIFGCELRIARIIRVWVTSVCHSAIYQNLHKEQRFGVNHDKHDALYGVISKQPAMEFNYLHGNSGYSGGDACHYRVFYSI